MQASGSVGVGSGGEINRLRIGVAVKQLLEGGVDFGGYLLRRMTGFSEQVAVLARDGGGAHPDRGAAPHPAKQQRAGKGFKHPVHGRPLNRSVSVLIVSVY